nr:uncharacterized protein LOC106731984 [Pelodiscus sinensis]XP_025040143.1 uncharacterized protein LOC106731984 [Pelodiscus sinensis]|eukprot:XP_014428809.1 uncharacterized protein LOC106731984 [Pelodiscus sinensis]
MAHEAIHFQYHLTRMDVEEHNIPRVVAACCVLHSIVEQKGVKGIHRPQGPSVRAAPDSCHLPGQSDGVREGEHPGGPEGQVLSSIPLTLPRASPNRGLWLAALSLPHYNPSLCPFPDLPINTPVCLTKCDHSPEGPSQASKEILWLTGTSSRKRVTVPISSSSTSSVVGWSLLFPVSSPQLLWQFLFCQPITQSPARRCRKGDAVQAWGLGAVSLITQQPLLDQLKSDLVQQFPTTSQPRATAGAGCCEADPIGAGSSQPWFQLCGSHTDWLAGPRGRWLLQGVGLFLEQPALMVEWSCSRVAGASWWSRIPQGDWDFSRGQGWPGYVAERTVPGAGAAPGVAGLRGRAGCAEPCLY